jgi:hypothetical protein
LLKKSIQTLGALAVGFGAVLATATPAAAACSTNLLCLYQHNNYGGGKYTNNFGVNGDNYTYHDGDRFDNGYPLADAVTSYQNAGTGTAVLWTAHFYEGNSWTVYPRENRSYMTGFNDVASSHYWDSF